MDGFFNLTELSHLNTSISFFLEKLIFQLIGASNSEGTENLKKWIEEFKLDYKSSGTWKSEISVHHFPQLWPSTSGGWGGFGGSAMSTYYTTAIHNPKFGIIAVFYQGRLAYCMKNTKAALDSLREESLPGMDNLSNSDLIYKPIK